MQHVIPVAQGLRTLIEAGSDRFWFALAVTLGLFLASWLGHLALAQLIVPQPHDLGF
ncbi:MAG: hypothetical protein JJU15_13275 [Pararhodobacter sp.]|nr:hypothetical protein [Pararhodobacter sp.]